MVKFTPSNVDITKQIQAALTPGNELDFAPGNYIVTGLLTFASNIIWKAKDATFQGSSQMVTGDKLDNIQMSGGTYRGDGTTTNRLIEFSNTKDSHFDSLTIENTGHCFGLTTGCTNNVCSNLVTQNSLNGLADRGSSNQWNDCVSQNIQSDLFIIKCKDSTFTRCKVDGGGTAGFGFYARVDGSNNVGAEISGNKFYDCEAINTGHAGFSLNCPTNGTNAYIHDNTIQAKCSNNKGGGLSLVNNSPGGKNENNTFDIITHDNTTGGVIIGQNCNNNNGSVVSYANNPDDINIAGQGNSITAYHPADQSSPKTSGNTVTTIDFDCNTMPSNPPYCVTEYCNKTPPPTTLSVQLSITPNPASITDTITFKAIASGGQSPYTFAWANRPDVITDTVICTPQSAGTFIAGVTVTDSLGATANAQTQYIVSKPVPTNVSLQISPATITLGQTSTFTASATGGNEPYSYQWTLPSPCKSTDVNANSVDCKPDTAGNYNIIVTVTDSSVPPASVTATGQLTVIPPTPPPKALHVQLEINPKTVKTNRKTTITTKVSGGTKPYSYTYTGLPHPCTTKNKDTFDCTPDKKGNYNIVVTVSDSKNNSGTDKHSLTVN